jgi:hypothetical protein
VLFAAVLLSACAPDRVGRLERETLFSLDIGKLENELDFFQTSGTASAVRSHQFMRDGIFFVTNSNANKVMELTSFGDLLSMVYNPDFNPQPVLLNTNPADGTVTSRIAREYPLEQVGDVVVASDSTLFVEDRVSAGRSIFDAELGVDLRWVVLRFDRQGRIIDYIGQEGVGGSPFPLIQDLFITGSDELVVVTRAPRSWIVYGYSPEGDLQYQVPVPLDQLPVPANRDGIPELESIVPSVSRRELYLKVNFYETNGDRDPGRTGSAFQTSSRIYTLDLETGRYESFFEIPRNERPVNPNDTADGSTVRSHYELLGAAPADHLLFLSRGRDEEAELLIMKTGGRVVDRRRIVIEHSQLYHHDLSVSTSGILTAMLAWETTVQFVWWRSDRLLAIEEDS